MENIFHILVPFLYLLFLAFPGLFLLGFSCNSGLERASCTACPAQLLIPREATSELDATKIYSDWT